MRILPLTAALFLCASLSAQKVEKLWETDTTLAVPESVLHDSKAGVLYVSLIQGGPWEKDGLGGIALVAPDGTIRNTSWVTGLHAPKGMGLHRNRLYVADMSEVVVIDRRTGEIEERIPVAGGENLNDITVDKKGTVYVSDSRTGKVYRVRKGRTELFLSDLAGVNGLKAVGRDLYILTGREVLRADRDGNRTSVGALEVGGDGIEPVGNGDFIITAWTGLMHYLYPDGRKELLLDSREQKKQTADIGYNRKERIIYVPTFFGKSVVAYKLL